MARLVKEKCEQRRYRFWCLPSRGSYVLEAILTLHTLARPSHPQSVFQRHKWQRRRDPYCYRRWLSQGQPSGCSKFYRNPHPVWREPRAWSTRADPTSEGIRRRRQQLPSRIFARTSSAECFGGCALDSSKEDGLWRACESTFSSCWKLHPIHQPSCCRQSGTLAQQAYLAFFYLQN